MQSGLRPKEDRGLTYKPWHEGIILSNGLRGLKEYGCTTSNVGQRDYNFIVLLLTTSTPSHRPLCLQYHYNPHLIAHSTPPQPHSLSLSDPLTWERKSLLVCVLFRIVRSSFIVRRCCCCIFVGIKILIYRDDGHYKNKREKGSETKRAYKQGNNTSSIIKAVWRALHIII